VLLSAFSLISTELLLLSVCISDLSRCYHLVGCLHHPGGQLLLVISQQITNISKPADSHS
jgi:hypothetical protein